MSLSEAVDQLLALKGSKQSEVEELARELSTARAELSKIGEALAALGSPARRTGSHQLEIDYRGQYKVLWSRLCEMERRSIVVRFGDLEELAGRGLPPSARKHQAHWYGYDNSALARALFNAGWKASKVNLNNQAVELVPLSFDRPDACPVCWRRTREQRVGHLVSTSNQESSYRCDHCQAEWRANPFDAPN